MGALNYSLPGSEAEDTELSITIEQRDAILANISIVREANELDREANVVSINETYVAFEDAEIEHEDYVLLQ